MPLTQLRPRPGPPKGASLTAEPGFMGVAPGRGVNIWPPCGNQRSGVWVSLFPYSPWTPAFWTSYSPSLSARRCPRWSSAGHLPPGSTTARPQGWWAHPLCLTPVRIPGYTLGKGVGREEALSTTGGQKDMPRLFSCPLPYSQLESWNNRIGKVVHKGQNAALRDTHGAAAGEGSHLVTGSSPNFMSRRIAVGAV